jgi:hypothetical protein
VRCEIRENLKLATVCCGFVSNVVGAQITVFQLRTIVLDFDDGPQLLALFISEFDQGVFQEPRGDRVDVMSTQAICPQERTAQSVTSLGRERPGFWS